MTLYSYVITRDYGFAPNPFGEYCTLATCKPGIRKAAEVGDWVIGTGSDSQKYNIGNRLIYAMRIDEKISFSEYWNDPRFQDKKPVMNGSKKQKYGDNIYYFDITQNKLMQLDSHHSLADGTINKKNYDKDISGVFVLISMCFWYFGECGPQIPEKMASSIIKGGMGYKKIVDRTIINTFIDWLSSTYETGYNGRPWLFSGEYKRYDGN
ncbi:MAG: hypothetical protein PHG06_16095 [Parabacteroides sp.]|nr:hypothetical protein [Parabacteroides sp.]